MEEGCYARRVNHTQLTDEPCPECGASLDIRVMTPKVEAGVNLPAHQRETVRLERVQLCPDCGWSKTL